MLAVSLLCACSGISHETAGYADAVPPARVTFPPTTRATPPRGSEPFVAGTFDLDVVGEASGLALSVRNPGVAYVLDDGPGSTSVVAVDTATGAQTTVTVEGLEGRDTEALAIGACRGGGRGTKRTCLYIGDIGNNQGAWESVRVWRIREPDLSRRPRELTVGGDVARYTYPDEPIDAEALLVEEGWPYLITKESRDAESQRTPQPRLLAARRFGDGRLRDLGRVPLPEPHTGGFAAAFVGNVVTGAELAGGDVVLRSYDRVLIYTPHARDAPLRTLPHWTPDEVRAPSLPQGEGVAMNHCGVWLVSEQVDSIWLVPQPQPPADRQRRPRTMQEQECPTGTAPS